MADPAPDGRTTGAEGASPRVHRLEEECRVLSGRIAQAERELGAAKAELEVKDEFLVAVEKELEETLAHLRTKTAYIESLPWVRLRTWVAGLRQPK